MPLIRQRRPTGRFMLFGILLHLSHIKFDFGKPGCSSPDSTDNCLSALYVKLKELMISS